MLRSRLPRIGRSLRSSRRRLHSMPPLTHHEKFSAGVPGLLSPFAYDIAWNQYQALMIEKLNKLTLGTEDENLGLEKLAIKYARDPLHPSHFNYASMAFNNHFFFQGLSPKGPVEAQIPKNLERELNQNFGTMETLKKEITITARSMFGPGFVWLVKDSRNKYSVMCTYLAGSPYPKAHYRKQAVDMNTENSSQAEAVRRANAQDHVNAVGKHGAKAQKQLVPPGAADIVPVLCLNMWEHVYLPDYGVGGFDEKNQEVQGKKKYAEAWWDVIDWDVVANRAILLSPEERALER